VRIRMQEGQGAAVTPGNEDRIAYLAGEEVTSLPTDEVAALDALRAELGAAATWEEPRGELEDQVVMAVSRAAAEERGVEEGGVAEQGTAASQERGPQRASSPPSWWSRLRARIPLRGPALALSLSL